MIYLINTIIQDLPKLGEAFEDMVRWVKSRFGRGFPFKVNTVAEPVEDMIGFEWKSVRNRIFTLVKVLACLVAIILEIRSIYLYHHFKTA